jgi:hypothetical protein
MESQRWWIECKGRQGTVEPEAVKSAVTNSLAADKLDYLIIATNTTFSNPTRDWVAQWQRRNPLPKVRLWDRTQLERFLSRHPSVVLRLFSKALSPQGRLQALESRFVNKLEYAQPELLRELWKSRKELTISHVAFFALIVNEIANGSIMRRPWAAIVGSNDVVETLALGMMNLPYLMRRAYDGGLETRPIVRALSYLIIAALEDRTPEQIAGLITEYVSVNLKGPFSESVQEALLLPITSQLWSEMQDVCSSDCLRIHSDYAAFADDEEEIKEYWMRLVPTGTDKPEGTPARVTIELFGEPCKVGFSADKENHCPLFELEPTVHNTRDLLEVVTRVASFRKKQAIDRKLKDQADTNGDRRRKSNPVGRIRKSGAERRKR